LLIHSFMHSSIPSFCMLHTSQTYAPTEARRRKCHTFCRVRRQHFYVHLPSVQPAAGIVQVFTRRTHHLHHKTKKCRNVFPVWIRKHSPALIAFAALKTDILASFLSLSESILVLRHFCYIFLYENVKLYTIIFLII
jgi:hypothetical protein